MPPFEQAVGKYRARIDAAVAAALEKESASPIALMLRYFLGFCDADGAPVAMAAGRRVRPALLLLCAEAYGGSECALDLAAGVELFHNFTLIHDDIEDGDEMRRGRPTVWKIWGVNHAINAGDALALIASSALLRAAQHDRERGAAAAQLLMRHFIEVAEGQYLDFELTRTPLAQASYDAYLEMTRKKTSVLLGAAAAAGGIAAGASEGDVQRLYAYGESLGLAYQIADDIASLWSPSIATGKVALGDLHERKKTFPVLHAYETSAEREALGALFASERRLTAEEAATAFRIIDSTGAYAASKARAEGFVAAALEALEQLALPADARGELADIALGFVSFPKR